MTKAFSHPGIFFRILLPKFSINICSLDFMFFTTMFLTVASGCCWRVCLFFIMLALLSSFLISTRTVPKVGCDELWVGLEGSFLTALIMSLLTTIPGARISSNTCLIMSKSVYPEGGGGRNLTARPSLSETSFASPTFASTASSRQIVSLISLRISSTSGILDWIRSYSISFCAASFSIVTGDDSEPAAVD